MHSRRGGFSGSWVVVTGGSRGIGSSICKQFAESGANVAFIYLEQHEAAQKTLGDLRGLGVQAEQYCVDVADHGAVHDTFRQILEGAGKIDVLVNCAGINRDKTLQNLTAEAWERVLDTNLTGCFNCSQAVVPSMRRNDYGRIISISSIIALTGNIGQANYAASKSGMLGFTKSLALETAKYDITVNAVCPGFINAGMISTIPDKIRETIVAKIPKQRLGEPEEIARTVMFLASPESGYVTGQVISVNGGLYM
jgi:3-oxoacyl-(acyl-carrier-protein) reductase